MTTGGQRLPSPFRWVGTLVRGDRQVPLGGITVATDPSL